jgi:predicted ester cyclase
MDLNRRTLFTTATLAIAATPLIPTSVRAADADSENAALLDRYIAAFNAHDVDAFAGFVAPGYVQHNGRAGQGLAGLQAVLRGYFQTFPDFHMAVDDRIFGGDKLVARSTLSATHTQPVQLGPGAPVFPPTGRKLTWGGIDIWRAAGGMFVEHWDQNDFLGLSQQLRGA